jgi:hypothetical protein
MKTFLYCLAISCIASTLGFTQSKIDGIGKFKIGKADISIVDSVAAELQTEIKPVDQGHKIVDRTDKAVFELKVNKLKPYMTPAYTSYCPSVRVFYITTYTVADIEIKEIYLTFKDNMLIEFRSKSSTEIEKAIETKYGPKTPVVTKKQVKCRYKLTGNSVILENITYKKQWKNLNIVATTTLQSNYDDKCEKQYYNDLEIKDSAKIKIANDCEAQAKALEEKQTNQQERKKLSDF